MPGISGETDESLQRQIDKRRKSRYPDRHRTGNPFVTDTGYINHAQNHEADDDGGGKVRLQIYHADRKGTDKRRHPQCLWLIDFIPVSGKKIRQDEDQTDLYKLGRWI